MASQNGNRHGMVHTPIGRGVLRREEVRVRLPHLRQHPNVLANGKPEGFEVTRGTVTFYLCLECSTAWQNTMAQLMPFQVPRLVKRDE